MTYPKKFAPGDAPASVRTILRELLPRLLEGEHPTLQLLRNQLREAKVTGIELSGAGFFAHIAVPTGLALAEPRQFEGGSARIVLSGVEYGAGCVLFVDDGRLSLLECFTYGIEEWAEEAQVISIGSVVPLEPPTKVPWLEPGKHSRVTYDAVREAEAHFGVKFPASWVRLLREQNGGYIEKQVVAVSEPIPDEARHYVADGCVPVNRFFGIDPDPNADGTIYCSSSVTGEWELPPGLVLLDGDGHTWLAFDYRATKIDPAVVFVIADNGLTIPIAPSFDRFLRALTPYSIVFDSDGNRIDGKSRHPKSDT